MSRKKGIKKGSPQAGEYVERLLFAQEQRDEYQRHFGRVFESDMWTLALGRMGWTAEQFSEINKILSEVHMEYCTDIIEDYKGDKEIWYSKDTLDREIKQYVGEELFVPYEERYKW